MKLSIIVPVYNSEKYLKNTIDSVVNQSFTDWQLLLVNDGSTDNSLEICQAYAAQDSRISVFTQDNAGPSAARNNGIMNAQGDYIMFLDSDDEYLPDALSNVAAAIDSTGADRIISALKIINFETGKVVTERDYRFENGFETMNEFFTRALEKRLAPGPVRYAIKSRILHNNNLFFPVNIRIAEDCLWLNRVIPYLTSIKYNDKPYYQYNVRNGSLTSDIDFDRMQNLMSVADRLFIMAESETDPLKKLRYTWCCVLTNHMMQSYSSQSSKDKKAVRR